MWYLCGSESLSVRCTLPAGDKHVVIIKSDHYITYQLVFLSNSQIRSFRAYSLVSQAYLLVNEPRKTNVCFAAACFSLRPLFIHQVAFFQTRKSALSELIRLFHKLICSLMSPEKQMSASQPLVFLCGSLYHKIATEKSNIFFSNFQFDKIHIFSLFVAYVAIIIFHIVLILLH